MNAKRLSPIVSMYALTPQARLNVHVDQATESSMASIVITSMNVTRASPRVITYVQTPQAHLTAHVDQATESSMFSIVRTLMNASMPTTASTHAPILLAATHAQLNKKVVDIRRVSEYHDISK